MSEQTMLLFDKPDKNCTRATLEAAAKRAKELKIREVVIATTTGRTALEAADAFAGQEAALVGVTLMAGVWATYSPPDADLVRQAMGKGVVFLTGTHVLMGNLENAVMEKFGGIGAGNLISHTLYLFGQGVKVAVEVAVMAADAGLIGTGGECVAIAGTGVGADVALVLRPACSTRFFDLEVREIICMPRAKS
ncbi:MAG: hypothetical protein IT210_23470 [Armatimonadetes bacterium]|nr:hypothetical protein [Armatimonadota bacterium]